MQRFDIYQNHYLVVAVVVGRSLQQVLLSKEELDGHLFIKFIWKNIILTWRDSNKILLYFNNLIKMQ